MLDVNFPTRILTQKLKYCHFSLKVYSKAANSYNIYLGEQSWCPKKLKNKNNLLATLNYRGDPFGKLWVFSIIEDLFDACQAVLS